MNDFDDYVDEMSQEFESFAAGVRAAATRIPEPSPALAHMLRVGVSSPQPKRSVFMKARAYVTGLGLAAKIMLGAGVAAAATTGAAAAGVLPNPVEHVFTHSNEASGDHVTHDEPPVVTTTTIAHDEHHDGDGEGDTNPVVAVEPTTTTSTTLHHEEPRDHPSTTTTTMRHEEPTTTTTTHVENHNPESLSITCEAAHEPNRIVCRWTPSTNPEHARYALLRINNQNTEGRVVWTTETGLEYTDTTVNSGWGYGYRVVSLRSDGSTESHSNIFTIPCC